MINPLRSLLAASALVLQAQAPAGTPAAPEAPKPGWTLTGNAGLCSDYRYRGFTQTAYRPSWQGGFDVAHASGFYFGSWNANVEQALYRGASLEMDLYAGGKTAVAGVGVDLGALAYRYPTHANTGSVGEVHHEEIYLGLSYGPATLKYFHQLSNYFGLGDGTATDTKGGYYLDLGFAHDLGGGWGLNAHCGHQTLHHARALGFPANAVDDFKLGVTKDLKGWVASAAWIGTSRKDYFSTGVGAPEAAGRGAVVVGCARTF